MRLSKAAKIWIDYHKTHSKKHTVSAYRAIIERFIHEFGDGPVKQVTSWRVSAITAFEKKHKIAISRYSFPMYLTISIFHSGVSRTDNRF